MHTQPENALALLAELQTCAEQHDPVGILRTVRTAEGLSRRVVEQTCLAVLESESSTDVRRAIVQAMSVSDESLREFASTLNYGDYLRLISSLSQAGMPRLSDLAGDLFVSHMSGRVSRSEAESVSQQFLVACDLRVGRLTEAGARISRMFETQEGSPFTWLSQASLCHVSGDHQAARDCIRKAILGASSLRAELETQLLGRVSELQVLRHAVGPKEGLAARLNRFLTDLRPEWSVSQSASRDEASALVKGEVRLWEITQENALVRWAPRMAKASFVVRVFVRTSPELEAAADSGSLFEEMNLDVVGFESIATGATSSRPEGTALIRGVTWAEADGATFLDLSSEPHWWSFEKMLELTGHEAPFLSKIRSGSLGYSMV